MIVRGAHVVARATPLRSRVLITSIVAQYEESKASPGAIVGTAATASDKKDPGRNRGPSVSARKGQKRHLSVRCLSAVPRMSPSVAPESEEPYCAIASF